jgi:hypothetical protein
MRSSHVSHDPFLLTNARPHRFGLNQTMRGVDGEQYVDLEPLSRSTSSVRAIAWRIIGALAIVGAALGFVLLATQPGARKAILDWITFGVGAP